MGLIVRVVALLAAVGSAQTIQIRPRLAAGDAFRLEVTRVREDKSRPDTNYSIWTPVDVRVIAARNDGFEVEWRPAASVIEKETASDPGVIAGTQALGNLSYRISLTADGEFHRLLNEVEVRGQLTAAVGAMLRASVPEPERREQIREVLTPGFMVALATRNAEIYFGVSGLSLAVGDALEFTVKQPTPIGGVVPAIYRARLDAATAETATISTTTTYDADALLELTLAFLEKTGTKVPPEAAAKARLDLGDDGKYQVDRRLGLVREMTLSRRQSFAGSERLDRWTIKLVTPPRR
jgi:hypothetical protein